jgi:hypothetical protein
VDPAYEGVNSGEINAKLDIQSICNNATIEMPKNETALYPYFVRESAKVVIISEFDVSWMSDTLAITN